MQCEKCMNRDRCCHCFCYHSNKHTLFSHTRSLIYDTPTHSLAQSHPAAVAATAAEAASSTNAIHTQNVHRDESSVLQTFQITVFCRKRALTGRRAQYIVFGRRYEEPRFTLVRKSREDKELGTCFIRCASVLLPSFIICV